MRKRVQPAADGSREGALTDMSALENNYIITNSDSPSRFTSNDNREVLSHCGRRQIDSPSQGLGDNTTARLYIIATRSFRYSISVSHRGGLQNRTSGQWPATAKVIRSNRI